MNLTFAPSGDAVDAYDFLEVTAHLDAPTIANPFTDACLRGEFAREGEAPIAVDGFCDASDGSLYRIRFMPRQPGTYRYSVAFQHGTVEQTHHGTFTARAAGRRGLVRVDPQHPWHFLSEGTGEHYFWNSTTAYFLLGWDETTIQQSIERLHRLQINRLRVSLNGGRWESGQVCFEPIAATDRFTFLLNPWLAVRPESLADPGYDVTRFNLPYWQKYERLLRYARERDIVVSVIFYQDGRRPGVDPFGRSWAGGEDEQRYYRYAAARLGAFSNVMWDVTNEYQLFRDDAWAEQMGTFLKSVDPYAHLTSVHGWEEFPFRTSAWADFAMYQIWDEAGGNAFFLRQREEQAKTGRIIPQVNEEYGYEEHYPIGWGGNKKPPARSADTRRRIAWEISMAGCYQTTGERANSGTGCGPDTGGGWVNGRGDQTMVMLEGYARLHEFFTAIPWWRLEPRNDLVSDDTLCLAEPGAHYVLYLPHGGNATVQLEPGSYHARWYNPRTGEYADLPDAWSPEWRSPEAPDGEDWVILLEAPTSRAPSSSP